MVKWNLSHSHSAQQLRSDLFIIGLKLLREGEYRWACFVVKLKGKRFKKLNIFDKIVFETYQLLLKQNAK